MNRTDTRKLFPPHPPGHPNRKARAYLDDIARLVALGYGVGAIRAALADAGVSISQSTAKREVARARASARAATPLATAADEANATDARTTGSLRPASAVASPAIQSEAPSRSGREIAEAFVRGRVTHPLLRGRSAP
jgi:hypothetical protein